MISSTSTGVTLAVTAKDIEHAATQIRGVAHKTPVLHSRQIDEIVGAKVFFKCENFQRVGAFKFRGAYHALMSLSDAEAQRGLCTHSSGNHAQAIALAAQIKDIPAHIVMPSNSPIVKKKAVLGYGAHVYECEPNLLARETKAAEVIEHTGATFIHPYDDPRVIAGQGTAALELIEELNGMDGQQSLDLVIAPIGGGGLMSGTSIITQSRLPNALIWGAEPAGADDAARSLKAGKLIPQTNPQTICDGLLTSLGSFTWPIIQQHVSKIITVSDDQVRAALELIMTRLKIIIEPSCATPLAALIATDLPNSVKKIGVILSGGNLDLDSPSWRR